MSEFGENKKEGVLSLSSSSLKRRLGIDFVLIQFGLIGSVTVKNNLL